MDVEHTSPLGVRERPNAVLGGEPRERGRRLPASAQDHERDPLRKGDEDARTLAIPRADEPDRPGRQARGFECGPEDLVDEHGHGLQCRAARSQHCRVQALEQLAGDVEGHIGAGFEVRSDGSDRDPALAHAKPVRSVHESASRSSGGSSAMTET